MSTPLVRFASLAVAIGIATAAAAAAAPHPTAARMQPRAATARLTASAVTKDNPRILKRVKAFEDRQFAVQQNTAQIQTRRGLEVYLASHKYDSPFDALLPLDQQLFLDGIQFNSKGVVSGFNYTSLELLTPTQAYELLSLFGAQRIVPYLRLQSQTKLDRLIMSGPAPNLTPPFLMGAECAWHGTCVKAPNMACNTSTC